MILRHEGGNSVRREGRQARCWIQRPDAMMHTQRDRLTQLFIRFLVMKDVDAGQEGQTDTSFSFLYLLLTASVSFIYIHIFMCIYIYIYICACFAFLSSISSPLLPPLFLSRAPRPFLCRVKRRSICGPYKVGKRKHFFFCFSFSFHWYTYIYIYILGISGR